MGTITLVLAGRFQEYLDYCFSRGVDPRQVGIVYPGEGSESWRGLRDAVLVRTGTWKDRMDRQVYDELVKSDYFSEVRDEPVMKMEFR